MEEQTVLQKRTLVAHDSHDERHHGAVTFPIYQNTLFTFESQEALDAARGDSASYFYTRGNNPTVEQLEQRIAQLEGGDKAFCFASGMAAITAAIMSVVKAGDHIICIENAYGVTEVFLREYMTRYGVTTTFVDGTSIESIRAAVQDNTKLIYLESPTSLTFELQDLRACAELAKNIGAVTIIDNTWATPVYQNPIALGIDLVVHSISKYLGGHSDTVGGAVVGLHERMKHMVEHSLIGGIMSPHSANLVMRGIRTLPLRMEKAEQNGLQVAAFIERQPIVTKVNHPGLPSHPQHALYKEQMKGSGSLFSFEMKLSMELARKWINALAYFRIGVSWGGYESLALVIKQTERQAAEGTVLVRLYAGLENPADLTADLANAFSIVEQHG